MKKILIFCSIVMILSGCTESMKNDAYKKALNASDLSNLSRIATSYISKTYIKGEAILFDDDNDLTTPDVPFNPSNPKKSTSASIVFKSLIPELGVIPLDKDSINKVDGTLSYGEYGVTPFFKENEKYYFVIYGQSSNDKGDSQCESLNNADGSINPIVDGNDCFARKVEYIFTETNIETDNIIKNKIISELEVEANAEEIIKTNCKEKYPTKRNMESYCIKNQIDAINILRNGQPSDIKEEHFKIIRKQCSDKWHVDFKMREYCESEQFEAIRVLGLGKPSDISNEKYKIVRSTCADKWPLDFNMREYCEREQFEAIRNIKISFGVDASEKKRESCELKWKGDFNMILYCMKE